MVGGGGEGGGGGGGGGGEEGKGNHLWLPFSKHDRVFETDA